MRAAANLSVALFWRRRVGVGPAIARGVIANRASSVAARALTHEFIALRTTKVLHSRMTPRHIAFIQFQKTKGALMRSHAVIAAIAALLIGGAYANHFASAATPISDDKGKVEYDANCKKCHGVRGIPPKSMKAKFPKLATFDAAFFAKHPRDSIVKVLTKGKNADMKSFKDKLSHEQMEDVAEYMKTFAK
jgi:mono/diheme cytochrome c family protein